MAKPNGLHLQLGWVNLQLLPDLVCFANAGVGWLPNLYARWLFIYK